MRLLISLVALSQLLACLGAVQHVPREPGSQGCKTNAECLRMGKRLLKPAKRSTRLPHNKRYTILFEQGCATHSQTGSVQAFSAPQAGRYQILAIGGAGGRRGNQQGGAALGAGVVADYTFAAGDAFNVVIGCPGQDSPANFGAGGGGTSVVESTSGSSLALVFAGGGGGSGNPGLGKAASTTLNAVSGGNGDPAVGGGLGGTGGNGGGGGSYFSGASGGGGAGYLSVGQDGFRNPPTGDNFANGEGGRSKAQGWTGGLGRSSISTPASGGFGGGGGGGTFAGGGGGGYNGGGGGGAQNGAGNIYYGGGGGSSFVNTAGTYISSGSFAANSTGGLVRITFLD